MPDFAAKNAIFVGQKVQISSKNLPQIPNFANFVKNQHFRHDGQFSSFRQFFVKNEIPWSVIIRLFLHVCQVHCNSNRA